MKELFVPNEKELSGIGLIAILDFPTVMDEDETTTRSYLKEFLQDAPQEILKHFLTFATGSPCLPNFGLGRIGIKFENVTSIYASTCLQKVTFPKIFPNKSTFSACLEAIFPAAGKSFNCV